MARYNTFASGGSDGTVSIWDHKVKKRLKQYPKYPAPVPAVAFNCDGTKLAVGSSYTWDEGEEGAKTADRPKVFVRVCGDEVKVTVTCSFKNPGRLTIYVAKGLGGTLTSISRRSTGHPGVPNSNTWCSTYLALGDMGGASIHGGAKKITTQVVAPRFELFEPDVGLPPADKCQM